jgi:hypothetical protein
MKFLLISETELSASLKGGYGGAERIRRSDLVHVECEYKCRFQVCFYVFDRSAWHIQSKQVTETPLGGSR